MDTSEIDVPDGETYGAGKDEFAIQGDGYRAIISIDLEGDTVDQVEETLEDFRGMVSDGFIGEVEIVPREETDIPVEGFYFKDEDEE